MASHTRRYRSSTGASYSTVPHQDNHVLSQLLERVVEATRPSPPAEYPVLLDLCEAFRPIHEHIVALDPPSHAQDDFRRSGGFEKTLDTLRIFSGFFGARDRAGEEGKQFFELLHTILATISASLRGHNGNQRYYKHKIVGGGWETLEHIFANLFLGGIKADRRSTCQLFGELFSVALDDQRVDNVFRGLADEAALSKAQASSVKPPVNEMTISKDTASILVVQHWEVLRIIQRFWDTFYHTQNVDATSELVLDTILEISRSSLSNASALHEAGTISWVARCLNGPLHDQSSQARSTLLQIGKEMVRLGVPDLLDARPLLAHNNEAYSELCREMTTEYSATAYIHFDLSLHGFASVELPTLGRTFPPTSNGGYTFTAWLHINQYDPNSHTTIFGVFDASQTCFLLAYLERDTHNFILQTSITSSRPSVRFKSVKFQQGQWYHIALVHKRPKTLSPSKASLFVDGEFVEQVKSQYPASPGPITASTESFASFSSTNTKTQPVQAFLGTPRDLAGKLGAGHSLEKWSLASAHLIEDLISDDLIAVHYRLGPGYHGNFQDCLGSFQTYEASAALGLRNESLHPGTEESSEIMRVISDRASNLMPEHRMILSIHPGAAIRATDQFAASSLGQCLSRATAMTLRNLITRSGNAVVINAAIPSVNVALLKSNGVAMLTGNPAVVMATQLEDNLWRLGGFTPVALRLLERTTTEHDFLQTVAMVYACINKSWRNSDAMERDNGYAILAMIIKGKLGFVGTTSTQLGNTRLELDQDARRRVSLQLLRLTLQLVGYNYSDPLESFIINPLAYRILLIDFDLWRQSSIETHELYYQQFIVFATSSKHHLANGRRLLRMRVVKRLIDALKAETIMVEALPHFITAFETLIAINFTTEVHRGLALFITYAFHTIPTSTKTPQSGQASHRSGSGPLALASRPRGLSAPESPDASSYITRKGIGTRILQMYTALLCSRNGTADIKKFGKTVTNKWLLYLLSDDDPVIVACGTRIVARVLFSHGSTYTSKFATKTGGFEIMAHRLRKWWSIDSLWLSCLSILFGYDIAEIHEDSIIDLDFLLRHFGSSQVTCSEALPVIMALLQSGLRADPQGAQHVEGLSQQFGTLNAIIQFLSRMYAQSTRHRDYAAESNYTNVLISTLYPVITNTDAISPDVELNSKDSALTFEGAEVTMPTILGSTNTAPIVKQAMVSSNGSSTSLPSSTSRGSQLRRASSFVLVTAQPSPLVTATPRLTHVLSPRIKSPTKKADNTLIVGLTDLVVDVLADQVLARKDFFNFNLHMRIPPGFQEHQAYFETFILRAVIARLWDAVDTDHKILCEPKILANISRCVSRMSDTVFQGWFMDGAAVVLDFAGHCLTFLTRPDISALKIVRLCSQHTITIQAHFIKLILLMLSDADDAEVTEEATLSILERLFRWQTAMLDSLVAEDDLMKLLWYQLYIKLIDKREAIQLAAAGIWRMMVVKKPRECSALFAECVPAGQQELERGFQKIASVDDGVFLAWVDQHRPSLDMIFLGGLSKPWEDYAAEKNRQTLEQAKSRLFKRQDKLKQWHTQGLHKADILLRHDMANGAWMKSIYVSEHNKHQRLVQDQQDDALFLASAYRKMNHRLTQPGGVFENGTAVKWKLDRTEGRNRMRLRLLPDSATTDHNIFQSRQAKMDALAPTSAIQRLRVNTGVESSGKASLAATPVAQSATTSVRDETFSSDNIDVDAAHQAVLTAEDDFEFVHDPYQPDEGEPFEDKNRKIMRRLELGDSVQSVFNISRIVGLEACEGILIIGKDAMYIMDNVFRQPDGEIINVWQAPPEERDLFAQIVMDKKNIGKPKVLGQSEQESRSWRWHDVISISKRRFLTRNVALEVFFTDGRSYLLTAHDHAARDDVFKRLSTKTTHTSDTKSLPNPEDAWRLETLRINDESTQSFGSKFGNIFNASPWNPSMRRWQKGEISNFHYLMLVNTMAGRTFNDLTQYPVFPWVLADYTSQELDLDNPASFRDLAKPMGAQTASRQTDLMLRYSSLAEMGETPYHYGTHYSSAMTVTGYLVRLPPFVQSAILLQGGHFDHPDRMFYSIAGAWKSASHDIGTDVRELIPEFFYLPEMLTNLNGYDFGSRQGTGGKIDDVILPPWAKGDPKVFIAKHREALESPYVTAHLQHWIDLVFGYKQQGEAAVESLNVFHHMSYQGAVDLDTITDPQERAIHTGVIHNFGQTPYQVFSKPHPARESGHAAAKRLDSSVDLLFKAAHPILESHERVASLIYAPKLDRLLCTSPLRANLPPTYEKFLEWGFADNSVRFFMTDNRKPAGLFENLHLGQISCVVFADSKTLITAGEDCVVSVHNLKSPSGKSVELSLRQSLFGHKTPVTCIAVSKAFSTFLTVSRDGTAFLWDLNRLELIRKLNIPHPSVITCARIHNVSGEIMLCSGSKLSLYTLNGDIILEQDVCNNEGADDIVYSCAYYEGVTGNEWLENFLIFTGHRNGCVNVWRKIVGRSGKWILEFMRRLDHVDSSSESGGNVEAAITCVTPMPMGLYTGDEDGRVYEWKVVQRDR